MIPSKLNEVSRQSRGAGDMPLLLSWALSSTETFASTMLGLDELEPDESPQKLVASLGLDDHVASIRSSEAGLEFCMLGWPSWGVNASA